MPRPRTHILSPVAEVLPSFGIQPGQSRMRASTRGIGLIDNSKPNVAHVVQALRAGLRDAGETKIVTVTKPRSAGPSPDISFLAENCRFVVNAVAD